MVSSIENKPFYWQDKDMFSMLRKRQSCYCAFCKNPRKVYKNKNLNIYEVLALIGFSFVITHVVWQTMDPRGLFILALLLITSEAFTQIKWRQTMICHNCGFDPVLYLRNPEKAGMQIKEFLEMRADNPDYLLKPRVILPFRKPPGQNLSLRG